MNNKIRFNVSSKSAKDQSILCSSLEKHLVSLEGVDIRGSEKSSISNFAQDFGSSLAIILGTPAALAIAKGIYVWLKMNQNATIDIEDEERKIKITGLDKNTSLKVIEEYFKSC
jgi:hypothetical protein